MRKRDNTGEGREAPREGRHRRRNRNTEEIEKPMSISWIRQYGQMKE